MADQLAASFPINQIAHEVQEALVRGPGWADLKACVVSARTQVETFWSGIDAPQLPSLEEVRRYVRELAQTPSIEDIAVRARERLLELVYARLSEAASWPQGVPAV